MTDALVRAAAAVATAGVLLSAGHARAQDTCTAYVVERNTRALYDALVHGLDADGCELDDVRGTRTTIRVVWKKDGTALAPALVTANVCALPDATRGAVFAVTVPVALASVCPTATRGLRHTVAHDTLGGVSGPPPPRRSWTERAAWIAGALVALVAALGAVAWWRGRGR